MESSWLIFILFPLVEAAVPGTFFWQPRLGIDLAIPTTEYALEGHIQQPTGDNVNKGTVVLIDGYSAALTLVALAGGIADANPFPHLNPSRAFFYTQVYRWALRHISMMPFWLGGTKGSYTDTHKVWKRRFFYMDEIMPKWMRKMLFFVKEKDWDAEIKDVNRYKKYSEYAFAKHYRYPNRYFNNFRSLETEETEEVLDSQSSSFLSDASLKG